LGAQNWKFQGQYSKFLLRGLLPPNSKIYSTVFSHFGGPKTQNLGAKLEIFTPGSFAPNSKFLLHRLLPIFVRPNSKFGTQ
jgi:hypothetical protein